MNAPVEPKPKPLAFQVKCGADFAAVAKVGARIIGWAVPSRYSEGPFCISGSRVHEKYRRRGVATALYRAVEQAAGKPLVPSGSLSDEAFAFWCNFRPEAVANDLRHRKVELLGKPVVYRLKLATIDVVGSAMVGASFPSEGGGALRRLYIGRDELPEALAKGVDCLRAQRAAATLDSRESARLARATP